MDEEAIDRLLIHLVLCSWSLLLLGLFECFLVNKTTSFLDWHGLFVDKKCMKVSRDPPSFMHIFRQYGSQGLE